MILYKSVRLIFLLLKNSFYFWYDIADKFFIAFFSKPDFIDAEYEEVKIESPLTYSHLRTKNKLNKNV